MESRIAVALAAKLLKIFPTNAETFLTFPTSGAAFTRAELEIFDGGGSADIRARSRNKAQFARLMNQVPVDAARWSTTGEQLDTAYKRVLEAAQMATTELTTAEHKALDKARDYLIDTVRTDAGPTTVYSKALVKYYQYKEAADEIERAYLDEKLTAELSQDPAVKQAWEDGRRATLEQARKKAAQDWAVLGNKDRVESAQATVAGLTGKDPQVRRVALLADYEACTEVDLDSNDPVGVRSTFYSPSDVFSPGTTWSTLHLTGDEVASLLADAPAELTSLAGGGAAVKEVEVEYTTVTVMRPWFEPAFLAMRSWRLADDTVVSNGEVPRDGEIPGYITELVVARKVTVVHEGSKPPTGGGETPSKVIPQLGYLGQAFKRVDLRLRVMPMGGRLTDVEVPAPTPVAVPSSAQLMVAAPNVALLRNPIADIKADRTTVTRLEPLTILRPTFPQSTLPPPPAPPSPPPGQPTPAPANQVTEEITVDGVVVLAYRVRRTPKCPNPDPALAWETEEEQHREEDAGLKDGHRFPLRQDHFFGRRGGPRAHDGTRNGADRVSVLALQTRLRELGLSTPVNGVIRRTTEQSIRKFQRDRGLKVDGTAGPNTWKALWT